MYEDKHEYNKRYGIICNDTKKWSHFISKIKISSFLVFIAMSEKTK